MKNYYAILEIPVGCSLEEIRQAYHRLVQEHLDDEAVFADLKEAYEVLTTPSRRDEYDRIAWGETFDSPSSLNAASSGTGPAASGRCPMGAEAQCPVLLGRSTPADKFCPECGYGLAALSAGASFDLSSQPDPHKQVWLEDRGGQTHALRNGINIVGRENADVLVPDKTVSRNHARLELDETGGLTVEDMSSTNGTQVNEELLVPHVPRSLADRDRLRFGSVFLVLHLPGLDADSPEPANLAAGAPARVDGALPTAELRGQVTETRDGSERVFPLAQGITTFGRRAENSVVLTGDPYVSGNHAQIRADGDVFILTDLGSTNGTLLNGERLKINTPVTLDEGDMVVIGGTALRFDRLGARAVDPEDSDEAEDLVRADLENAEPDKTDDAQMDDAQMAETAPAELRAEDIPRHAEG